MLCNPRFKETPIAPDIYLKPLGMHDQNRDGSQHFVIWLHELELNWNIDICFNFHKQKTFWN
jgi:hypothetical protein